MPFESTRRRQRSAFAGPTSSSRRTTKSDRPLRPPFAGLALVVVLLAGCAAPATRVVLLPQEDGSPSAVVVRTSGGEQLVSRPYQRATAPVGSTEAPTLDKADPAEVRAENKQLFELAPPKPQRFDLFFDVGATVLTPESQRALDGVVSAAPGRSGADITVTGHTDTQGSLQQNNGLALRRAGRNQAVAGESRLSGSAGRGRWARRARTGRTHRR